MRQITVPSPITLQNPNTGELLLQDNGQPEPALTFKDFIARVLSNPCWITTYDKLKSACAIAEASSISNGVMKLSEENWKQLEDAVRNPKQIIVTPNGPIELVGFGFHPVVTRQLVPMVEAVLTAETIQE